MLALSVSRTVVMVQMQRVVVIKRALPNTPDINMSGTVGYTLNFDTVNLRVEKISHRCTSTGTLKLVLWAVTNFTGRTDWSGTRVAEVRLDACSQNECYVNINKTAARNSPSAGSYTMILSLESCQNERFIMEDYYVFDGRQNITSDAKFVGTVGYTTSGSSIQMRAEKISHNFCGNTGTLMLLLWACSSPAANNQWTGYKLAEVRLDPLEKGYSYTNVVKTVEGSTPASGHYYMILQLKSFYNGSWVGEDYRQFDSLASF